MNSESYKLAEKLIPSAYVQQGVQARRTRENAVRHLLEQVKQLVTRGVFKIEFSLME